MSKALRLSEKWFRFGLWIVAFVLTDMEPSEPERVSGRYSA